MNKMAATPIYGKKPFKNLLHQNQKAADLGTWYVAFSRGTKVAYRAKTHIFFIRKVYGWNFVYR